MSKYPIATGEFRTKKNERIYVNILSSRSPEFVRVMQFVADRPLTISTEGELLIDKLHNTRAVLRIYQSSKYQLVRFIEDCLTDDDVIVVDITDATGCFYRGFLDMEGMEFYDSTEYGYILELAFGDFNPLKRVKAEGFDWLVKSTDLFNYILKPLCGAYAYNDHTNLLSPEQGVSDGMEVFGFERRILDSDASMYDVLEVACEAMCGSLRQVNNRFTMLSVNDVVTNPSNYGEAKTALDGITRVSGTSFGRFVYNLNGCVPTFDSYGVKYVLGQLLYQRHKCGLDKIDIDPNDYVQGGSNGIDYTPNGRSAGDYYDRNERAKGSGLVYTPDGVVIVNVERAQRRQYIIGNAHYSGFGVNTTTIAGGEVTAEKLGISYRDNDMVAWGSAIITGHGSDLLKWSGKGTKLVYKFDRLSYPEAPVTLRIIGGRAYLGDDVEKLFDDYANCEKSELRLHLLLHVEVYAVNPKTGAKMVRVKTSGLSSGWRNLSEVTDYKGYWLDVGDMSATTFRASLILSGFPSECTELEVVITGDWKVGAEDELHPSDYQPVSATGTSGKTRDEWGIDLYKTMAHDYGAIRYIESVEVEQGQSLAYQDRKAELVTSDKRVFLEELEYDTRLGTARGTGAYIFEVFGDNGIGENLINNSNDFTGFRGWEGSSVQSDNGGWGIVLTPSGAYEEERKPSVKASGGSSFLKALREIFPAGGLKAGEPLSFSVMVRNNRNEVVKVYASGLIGSRKFNVAPYATAEVKVSGKWRSDGIRWFQFQLRGNTASSSVDVDVWNMKLERGADTWTPWVPSNADGGNIGIIKQVALTDYLRREYLEGKQGKFNSITKHEQFLLYNLALMYGKRYEEIELTVNSSTRSVMPKMRILDDTAGYFVTSSEYDVYNCRSALRCRELPSGTDDALIALASEAGKAMEVGYFEGQGDNSVPGTTPPKRSTSGRRRR